MADSKLRLTSIRSSWFVASIIGATLFFLFGPWLSEQLVGYGFEIFAPTVTQNIALFIGVAMYFPVAFFFDTLPESRFWMAVNGAVWGLAINAIWVGLVALKRSRTQSREVR